MKPIMRVMSVVCGIAVCAGAGAVEGQGPSAVHLASAAGEAVTPARGAFAILETGFAQEQLRYDRVRAAHLRARPKIDRMFYERGITYPAAEMYIRVFKRERELEVWVRSPGEGKFQHLKTYGICGLAGKPGPKRRQGDRQVPEGFYHVDVYNPQSQYHLSLGINYPNARDRATRRPGTVLGGDIFIHGDCVSEGCLAITNGGIEELYWLAIDARAVGQSQIPVHIFPARIDARELRRLRPIFADQPQLLEFWETLRPGYEYFEKNRRVPPMVVDARGRYRLVRAAS